MNINIMSFDVINLSLYIYKTFCKREI
jgi:hypothetical protein